MPIGVVYPFLHTMAIVVGSELKDRPMGTTNGGLERRNRSFTHWTFHCVTSPSRCQLEPTLTEREKEITRLLAEGFLTKQVADMLHISVKTVDYHRGKIARKLGGKGITALVRYAIREGLIKP